jgi:hypothetical protein
MNSTQKINILKQFHTRLLKERFINNQASVYYSSQNSKFVIPGILITGVSSIISFMATSDLLNTGTKSAFSIGVGIFTAGATILQSISSSFGFQSRAEGFQKAADSYDTLITKIEFEINNPNEDFNDFCNNLETAILDIKNNCKYLPPLFVYKLWDQFKSSDQFESNSIDINSYHNNLNTPQTQNQNQQQNQDTLINIEDNTTNNNENK